MTRRHKAVTVIILLISITLLHYLTKREFGFQHVFYRELYFLPIIISAFWFGLRGGLVTSLAISILYIPYILQNTSKLSVHDFGNLLTIFLFPVVGGLLGWMRDRETFRQKELCRAESLVAMGKAVSCIAHDMKTPLIAIGGLTSQILKKAEAENPFNKKLEMILTQSTRLETMTKDMLAFSQPLKLQESKDNLYRLIKELTDLVSETAAKKNIELKIISSANLSPISVDQNRLQQVFLNLISNALEASPPAKSVVIKIKEQEISFIVDIIDQGPGIPPESSKEIFAPFFTTKKEGTGLGLCISKKIINAHGGRLQVITDLAVGTIFRVELLKK